MEKGNRIKIEGLDKVIDVTNELRFTILEEWLKAITYYSSGNTTPLPKHQIPHSVYKQLEDQFRWATKKKVSLSI